MDGENKKSDDFENPDAEEKKVRRYRKSSPDPVYKCGLCGKDSQRIGSDNKNDLLRCNHCSWSGAVPKNR